MESVRQILHLRPRTQTESSVPKPYGVKVLHDDPDATVDICFVHGLTGDRDSTWTAEGQSAPWPKIFLPPKLAEARIKARLLTYGYDAYVVRKSVASQNRLIDHSTNLLFDLVTDRASCGASSRPIIFVAHSLGGLACKLAILRSKDNADERLRSIFLCVKGIIFMGTPHKGSWTADWARIPASALGFVKSTNKSLLQILGAKNESLELIQVDFLEMLRTRRDDGRPLEVMCFYEELPLLKTWTIVSKESAVFEGHTPISIHADHRDMVKFASAEDNGFKRLLGVLVMWEQQVAHHLSTTVLRRSQDCLKSLAFPQMQDRFSGIRHAVTGTCEWLLRHETYRRWADCDQGILWIKGKPGSGKSTLLKHAVKNCKAGQGDFVLSFFFHGRGDALQKTPLGLYRSLLHQILSQAPETLQDLIETFEKRRTEMGEPGERWNWNQEELQDFIRLSLPRVLETRSVWLFIDALDECGRESAVDLIRYFRSLLESLPARSGHLRICFACRPYPILDLDGGFEIRPETQNQGDIAAFVYDRLSAFHKRMPSDIPALIADGACGLFMWARLVVTRVLDLERDGAGLAKIKSAVASVPRDLNMLYNELIKNMEPESLKLIQWICFAKRPLSIEELRWAMVIEPNCQHQSLQECESKEDVPDRIRMERQVQTLSCGLAEVTDTHHVQFIHQSVKDFFVVKDDPGVEEGLLVLEKSATSIDQAIGMAHCRLSGICIRYLAMEEVRRAASLERGDITSRLPFIRYATTSWIFHMQQSDAERFRKENLLSLLLLGWPSSTLVQFWASIYGMVDRYSQGCPPKQTCLVHIIARYGVLWALEDVLQTEHQYVRSNIDSRDGWGRTPLSWAAGRGSEVVVQLLLDKGAEFESRDNEGRMPLSGAAAAEGGEAVVELLLDKGAEFDSRDNEGRTPLSWAAARGHEAVMLLLESNIKSP